MTAIIPVLTLIFGVAALILFLVHRINLPVYPVYIGTGVLVGYVLDVTQFQDLASLGIIFLIFFVGLHTRTHHLARNWQSITLTAVTQAGILMVTVFVIMYITLLDGRSALLISMAAALSSTLVGHDLVEREVQLDLMHGRIAEGINIAQDIAAAVLIVLFFAHTTSAALTGTIIAGGLILAAFLLRSHAATVLNVVTGRRPELLLIAGLAVLLAVITGMEYVGIPAVIGAYVAGVLFSRPVADADLVDALDPLQDFFTVFTFIFIGAILTVPTQRVLLIAILLIFCSALLTPVVFMFTLSWLGHDSRTAYLTAFRLDQISEFAVITAITGYGLDMIPGDVFQGVLLAFAVTLTTSALTARFSEQLYTLLFTHIGMSESRHTAEHTHIVDELDNHIILAGYGNMGQALVSNLPDDTPPILAIDYDPIANQAANNSGINHIFGDLLHPPIWDRAHADDAALIISTLPAPAINHHIRSLDTGATKLLITDHQHPDDDTIITVSHDDLTTAAVKDIVQQYIETDTADTPER